MRITQFYRSLGNGTAVLALAVSIGASASAQTAGEDRQAPSDDSAQARSPEETGSGAPASDIVVTGSRLQSRGFTAPTPVAVLDSQELSLSGTVNVETLLNDTPQFIGSQNNGPTGNSTPGGTATVNLRGFGANRNLVLVNGRRFAISGPDQTTDLNTIPVSLIKRTEIVTGGSSAVYGSDAITGVVNFVMRDDFEGVETRGDIRVDGVTGTPTYNLDLTFGGGFSEGRGNVVASINYLNRGSITRGQRGDPLSTTLTDGCVSAASYDPRGPGTPLGVPSGQTCRGAGGLPGLVFGGSGTIPNGRFTGIPLPGAAGTTPAYNAALAAAGLGSLGGRGFTFNDEGTTVRPALTPGDDYDLGPASYLIVPQERWMGNVFAHYDFTDKLTGYAELHYSNNRVTARIPPAGVSGNFLIDVTNPYLSPELREVLRQVDVAETGPRTVTNGALTLATTPNDGRVVLNVNRRLPDVGDRIAVNERSVFRAAVGVRGELGSVSNAFLRDLKFDTYYTFARMTQNETQSGSVALSRFQQGLLSQNGQAPLLNIFGQNLTPTGVNSIAIASINATVAQQQVLAGTITGELFELPAGPVDFVAGIEHRKTSARFTPDSFLSSGDVSGFNPARATQGSVSVTELFGEARIPILRDTPFFERLSLSGAFRYSDYDIEGVGGVWTYSMGGEWAPVRDVTFRGQYQRAIRAPNVAELYGGLTNSGPSLVDPCSSRQPTAQQTTAVRDVCVATGVPAAAVFTLGVQPNQFITQVLGGNPNVGAETSDTVTLGVVLTPRFIPRLAVSIDYFNIDLDGAIAPLGGGPQNVLNLCYNILQDASSEFCRAVNRDTLTGQIAPPNNLQTLNANTGGLKTKGIDVEVNYSLPLNFGLFSPTSRLELQTFQTYTDEFTVTPVQAFPDIQNNCAGAFGQNCGQPIPRWKGFSRVTYRTGPLSLSLRHRYVGKVTVDTYVLPNRSGGTTPDLANLTKPVIPTVHYFDLSGSVDASETLNVTFGIRNLFDRDPPILGSAAPASNTFAATYDVEGQVFFAGVTKKF
jgi:outer membrane receptor protein involved in Fe transport